MTTMEGSFALGHPRFRDARIARCAAEQGALAAWRELLQADPVQALRGVEGDFAISLRHADRWFVAVDRFAVRTVCWRLDQGVLRVAPRADLLADSETEIDPQAIYDYLFFHVIPSPRTIFRGVYRLPPGHCLSFDGERVEVAAYWLPAFEERAATVPALRDEFRSLLRQAVRTRLDGSPPACFLSGGTDSSTIAGLIGEVTGVPALSFSMGFEAAGYDEMAYARLAARHFKTVHHEYYVTPDDLAAHMETVAAHYDQPFGNSSALPAYLCQMRAREQGVTRMLAGDGGDELFGGNERYARQRVFGWYQRVPAKLRSQVLEPMLMRSVIGRAPLLRKAASYIGQARIPLPDRMHTYNLLERLGPTEVLTRQFLEQIDRDGPVRQQRDVWSQCASDSELNAMLAFDWRYTLAENDLPKVCGTATLAGVDVAFPLLDDALLEFSMRLPAAYKVRGLTLRWFFKEALRGFLPDEIIRKRKHGFGLPFGVWLIRSPQLRALTDDALASLRARGIVRPEFVSALSKAHLAAHPAYYGEMVWILTMLELWLRRHAPRLEIARSTA
jgi:asparagine synthase (glutamine-hydrolysing)